MQWNEKRGNVDINFEMSSDLSWLLLEFIHSKGKIIKSHVLNVAAFCFYYF